MLLTRSQPSKASTISVFMYEFCTSLRKTLNLARMKDKGQRTRDGGTEDGKQRSHGQEQWNRATEKRTMAKGLGDGERRMGDRGHIT